MLQTQETNKILKQQTFAKKNTKRPPAVTNNIPEKKNSAWRKQCQEMPNTVTQLDAEEKR